MTEPQQTADFEQQAEDLDQNMLVTETSAEMVEKAARNFQEIPLDNFTAGRPLPADFFLPRLLREESRIAMVRVASLGHILRRRTLDQIREAGFSTVYVHAKHMDQVLPYLNAYTRGILDRGSLPLEDKAKAVYGNAFQIIARAMKSPDMAENLEAGREYVGDVVRFVQGNPRCLKNIHEVLATDYTLFTHSVNVCLLLISFGCRLGLKAEQLIILGLGGLFHDIGKRNIPEEILNKPGPLTDQEWESMRRHPAEGVQILRAAGNLPAETYQMVYQHHENLDGSGYPRGLNRDQISSFGQIIRIVDAYDALTSQRCYKSAAPAGEAVTILVRDLEKQINQELLGSFIVFLGSLAKS